MSNIDEAVLTTLSGTWRWWPYLQSVDFYPKGKHDPSVSLHIPKKYNTIEGAFEIAVVYEYKRVNNKIQRLQSIPKP